jgi:DNA excision repair protein ERCC-6
MLLRNRSSNCQPGDKQEQPNPHEETTDHYKSRLRSKVSAPKRFITYQEAALNIPPERVRNVVILPPENGDDNVATDEEGSSGEENEFPEPAGEVEVEENTSSFDHSSSDDEELNSPQYCPRWKKACGFLRPLPEIPCSNLADDYPHLLEMTEYDLWSTIFDNGILELIHQQTTLYARRDKNCPNFSFSMGELRKLLGIILISGYHSVPSERDYWSNQPDLKVPFVSESMSRNRYCELKSFLHLADNNNLEKGNKVAKVSPLYKLLNDNLQKHGIFHSDLSIDESMVPYFGKHSSKMFMHMKPIRIGYKLWILASPDGFPFALIIYTGKTAAVIKRPLGFRVVDSLLQPVKCLSDPSKHCVYFDNFFTSYDLVRYLHDQGFKATGTIRQNRTGGANKILIPDAEMKRKPRGTYDYCCDGTVFVAKWHDSAVVTIASNCHQHLPEGTANRRVGRTIERVPQPMLISKYNKGMGGVDLMDRLLGKYRPSICGKKWWWPLFTNALNVSVVAAWRMFCLLHPRSHESHLDFRRAITICLLKSDEPRVARVGGGIPHLPVDIRRDGVGHVNVTALEGRCVICGSNTKNMCAKCKVRLHFSHGKQCFTVYHS